jgi:hypothetical protein
MTQIKITFARMTEWICHPNHMTWICFSLAVMAGMVIMLNLMMGTLVGALASMFSLWVFWKQALLYGSRRS